MNEGIIAVRQTAKAARYGLIPSVAIIGATIAEPVIIATVPEPCGNLMIVPMRSGTRIAGIPIATIPLAII